MTLLDINIIVMI